MARTTEGAPDAPKDTPDEQPGKDHAPAADLERARPAVGLAARLARIAGQITRVQHDGQVNQRGESYSYTSIDAIADLARPLLAAEGVAIVPRSVRHLHTDEITSRNGARGFHVALVVEWTITDGWDELTASSAGASIDYSDKAYNKAHTFARKNLLVSLLNLSTGEDPDAEAPEAGHSAAPPARPQQAAPRQQAPPRPTEPAAPAWVTRQKNLEERALRDGITADEVEVAVSERVHDGGHVEFRYPRGLDDSECWELAKDGLAGLLTARAAREAGDA